MTSGAQRCWWLAACLLLLPSAFSIEIGGLILFGYRFVGLMAIAAVVMGYVSVSRRGRYILGLVASTALWMVLAFSVHHGVARGIEAGGAWGLDALGGVCTGLAAGRRASLRSAVEPFWMLFGLLVPLILIESLAGTNLFRSAAAVLLGGSASASEDIRLGLFRASGPFDHPIHLGLISAIFVAPAMLIRGGLTLKLVLALPFVVVALFSLSSGAIVVLAIQATMLIWNHVTMGMRWRWWALGAGVVLVIFAVEALSNRSAIAVFIGYLTLNPSTGYHRMVIAEWGWRENVLVNPIFGIGFGDWVRPAWLHSSSVDNFWLLQAMRTGLPSMLLVAAAVLLAFLPMRKAQVSSDCRIRSSWFGWKVSLVGLCVAGYTVHYWNHALFFTFLVIGLCVSQEGEARKVSRNYWRDINRGAKPMRVGEAVIDGNR